MTRDVFKTTKNKNKDLFESKWRQRRILRRNIKPKVSKSSFYIIWEKKIFPSQIPPVSTLLRTWCQKSVIRRNIAQKVLTLEVNAVPRIFYKFYRMKRLTKPRYTNYQLQSWFLNDEK